MAWRQSVPRPDVETGRIRVTHDARDWLDGHDVGASDLLWKHTHTHLWPGGDYGELLWLCIGNGPILTMHAVGDGTVYILTEPDRSATTVMLAAEIYEYDGYQDFD